MGTAGRSKRLDTIWQWSRESRELGLEDLQGSADMGRWVEWRQPEEATTALATSAEREPVRLLVKPMERKAKIRTKFIRMYKFSLSFPFHALMVLYAVKSRFVGWSVGASVVV